MNKDISAPSLHYNKGSIRFKNLLKWILMKGYRYSAVQYLGNDVIYCKV
jgi:hypothetical protein